MNLFTDQLEFFDGESIDDNYILLGNSKNYLLDLKGIKFLDAINFLYDNGKEYNYFFRMDYDINMILTSSKIDKESILKFFNSEKIKFKNYELQYFRNKIFIIKNLKEKKSKYFYDIFMFFNTSFVKVMEILELDKKFKKEYEFIKSFKLKRSSFNKRILNKIIEYNKLECVIGLEIVKSIYDLIPEDFKTLKLYGASSITNIYLYKNEIDKKVNRFKFSYDIFKKMYYGGRMEVFKVGRFEKVYKYDINSAYPSVIKDLRVIQEIKESKVLDVIEDYDIYYIEMKINDHEMIGLLPIRLKNGIVVYPNYVKGYYYGFEVRAVVEYSKKYDINYKILKRFQVIFTNEYLFNDIDDLYRLRLYYKEKKDKKHYIYKILLNSIYGKMSQRKGLRMFNNYYYSGIICSAVRGKLLLDFIDYAKDIIYIATDGILVLKENKKLEKEKKINNLLGNYEKIKIKLGYVIMSGLYYLIGYNNEIYTGERGFNISREDYKKIIPAINDYGKIKIINRVFVSLPYSIKNYKKFGSLKCKMIDIEKELNIKKQIKRKFLFNNDKDYLIKNYNSFILTKNDIDKISKINIEYRDLELFFDFLE